MNKKIFALLLFIMIMANISCLENDENTVSSEQKTPFLGYNSAYIGVGTFYQIGLSHQSKNNYYALRHHAILNPINAMGYGVEEYNQEFAFLIGKAKRFNFKNGAYIALSTGISYFSQGRAGKYLGYGDYEQLYYSGIGIPIDFSITKGFLWILGYSFNITININKENIFGGIFLNTHLGDFRNPDYVKIYSNPRIRDPKKNMATKKPDSIYKPKTSNIYNNLTIQTNPLRYLLNIRKQTLHVNGQISEINFYKNSDLVLDIKYEEDYKHSDYNYTYAHSKSFFKIDINLRKWLGKKENFYFEYGTRLINIIDFEDESFNIIMINGAFGYYHQLSNRFFINNSLSLAHPINNFDYFEQQFQGFGMNSASFMMHLSLLNIGINF